MSEQSTWIVAVSGGIDSAVLLHYLVKNHHESLVVAHVDHGIRDDSHHDAELVRSLAEGYGLPFETVELKLGRVSEEVARSRRHEWLRFIKQKYRADAIATAHHQDDIVETILINIERGTGWRGLCSLRESDEIKRPLLSWDKLKIASYAIENGLDWREDSTNDDIRYTRNYLRHGIVSRMSLADKRRLLELRDEQCKLRQEIEQECLQLLEGCSSDNAIDRHVLTMVDDMVGYELLRGWLGENYTRPTLRRILHFAKVARPGKIYELDAGRFLRATKAELVVSTPED